MFVIVKNNLKVQCGTAKNLLFNSKIYRSKKLASFKFQDPAPPGDRPGRTGGGCALYVHNSMAITDQVEFSDRCNNMTAVYIGSRHTIAAVVYRTGTDTASFQRMMDRLQVFVEAVFWV